MIRSKFSFFIYFLLFFYIGVLTGLGFYVLTPGFEKRTLNYDFPPVLAVAILLGILLFALFGLAKKCLLIKIKQDEILIRGFFIKKKPRKDEILSIDLFAKGSYYWQIGHDTIATKLTLSDGSFIFIPDPLYRNTGELKTALVHFFPEKINEDYKKKLPHAHLPGMYEYKRFAGNPVISINGFIFAGFALALLYLEFFSSNNKAPGFSLLATGIAYAGFGSQLYYFELSNQAFIVRNHFFPWIKKEYLLNEITGISVEKPYRRSNALRIINTRFKSKLYSAGSLRDKHWVELKETFENLGIHLMDFTGYYR